jgi:hypothetical protein
VITATRRAARTAAALACLLVAAGCGGAPAAGPARPAAPPAPPLATSFASAGGSDWAIVEMGGSAAQENNFWQLFVRPAAAAPWRQATPLGVADNGGLVAASPGGSSLLTGFRPSQGLTFSPLAASSDSGTTWSPTGPVNPGLANLPDALAAGPGGRVLALTNGGGAQLGTGLGSAWTHLSSVAALAATAPGRACGLTGLTAATFSSSGAPMLAGSCDRPGTAGIFADSGRGWQAAGPAIPAALAGDDIDVLRLASTGTGAVALLRAGTGPDTSLVAAFSSPAGGSGSYWALSRPLPIGSGQVLSTTIGPGSAVGVIRSGGTGVTVAGPGGAWQALPALPRWTATLALGPSGQVDAIAAHLGTFSDWRLAPGSAGGWHLAQTVDVTIPYGSSS